VNVDGLTGLPTRRALAELLPEQGETTVVAFDIHYLQLVSLDLGMLESDAVLIAVGAALDESARALDARAYRWGADEFVVPIPANDHAVALAFAHAGLARIDAMRLASRMRGSSEHHVQLNAVVCSIVRTALEPAGGLQQLQQWIADTIYAAKRSEPGRSGFVVDTLTP
jgi:diguanylate cyclase (GGDEF)-like protein